MIDFDHKTGEMEIVGYAESKDNKEFTERGIMNAYMEQAVLYSALPDSDRETVLRYMETRDDKPEDTILLQEYLPRTEVETFLQGVEQNAPEEKSDAQSETPIEGEASQYVGKKYKPVALKVKPLLQDLPKRFRIIRDIKGDPLADMPELKPISPEFTPTGRYTQERMAQFTELHKNFLLDEEMKLVHQLMMNQESAFAWDSTE